MARIKIENLAPNSELDSRFRKRLTGGSLVSPVALLGSPRRRERQGVAARVGMGVFRLLLG